MKIENISRGHIVVQDKGKLCTIQGEGLVLGENNSISYVIYENSIRCWDKPYDDLNITLQEKSKILNFIVKYFESKNQQVVIE